MSESYVSTMFLTKYAKKWIVLFEVKGYRPPTCALAKP